MLNTRLVRRQISNSRQSAVFVLCVALSMVTLVSLSGFSRSVNSSFLRDARALHAADIIIQAHAPFSPSLLREAKDLEQEKKIETARIYTFYSVVRTVKGNASLLADVKVVEPGYPFYGSVQLASRRPFHEKLIPGNVVVDQALLDRLHLSTGDRIRIGSAILAISDVVEQEPDRLVSIFSLGPRVFVTAEDLSSLDLMGSGSRVERRILAKILDQKELDRTAERLRAASVQDRERVETFRSAESRVKRFFDNFLFFLNMIGIVTLLLAGIGMQSSLTAFLKEQEQTIAIMKALGARSGFIIANYFAVVSLLGLAGTVLGLAGGFLFQNVLPGLFAGLLPPDVELSISWEAVAEGLLLGFFVVVLFTFFPLYRLKEIKPRAIFSREEPGALRDRKVWLMTGAVGILYCALVLLRVGEIKTGLLFSFGVALLLLAAFLCTEAILRFLKRRQMKNLILRQALKGLFRPRNATRSVMVTLTASLTVIFAITIVEENLNNTFVRSYPPDAPNLFFIDIQPGQKQAFAQELGFKSIYYPVVRGSIMAVNDQPLDREKERKQRGDNLAREFNLTYRENLLEDELIVDGKNLFREDWPDIQVSVLDTVLEMRNVTIGDTLTFRIQGVPLEARISSIRTRTRASLQPFFYFVFQKQAVQDAPHTFFTVLRVEKERIAGIQNRIVARFPNVTVIDVTEAVAVYAGTMGRLSAIVRFFMLFSVTAGILIIVSSIFATRYTRIQEAVYFTILGARAGFVLAVFSAESLLIGIGSALTALGLSQAIGWIICGNVLDIAYNPLVGVSFLLVLTTTLAVMVVAMPASISILRQKPAAFLREKTEE